VGGGEGGLLVTRKLRKLLTRRVRGGERGARMVRIKIRLISRKLRRKR